MNGIFKHKIALATVSGGADNPEISGSVKFYQKPMGVLIVAKISGLPENRTGFYGFHIHEGTDCGGEGFANTGSHYNPEGVMHPRHAGDLPPLLKCGNGAFLAVLTDRFKLEDIIGRTVVIHEGPDDFTTQPAGNAGRKIACGAIKKI